MLPGCWDPAAAFGSITPLLVRGDLASQFRCKALGIGRFGEAIFWFLAWDESLRGFLSSTAYALETTFKMLTLLWSREFDYCMGMCEWQSLVRGEADNRFRYFWCHIVCSPCGLFHLPHISNTHAASSSNEQHLDKTRLNFIFSYSRKDTRELLSPSSWGNITLLQHFSVCSETEPSLRHSPHPASRTVRAQHGFAPAPWSREVCNTSWFCTYHICQHWPHCHCHIQTRRKHHWLAVMENTSLTLSSFSFPPRDSLPARIFAPTFGAIQQRLLNDLAAFWQIVEPTRDQLSRFFAWFTREMELLQPRCPPICEILLSKLASC